MSTSDRQPGHDILDLTGREEWSMVRHALAELHPADIADLLDRAPHDARMRLFAMLGDDVKPDVLAELESVAEADVLEALSVSELSDIVEDMAPDDAADILAELPEEQSAEVLGLMPEEESSEVRKLLEYEEDTAGGIMTTDVVSMSEDQTVQEALDAIAYLDVRETFYQANLIDNDNRLVGYVDIWDLLRERDKQRRLGELAHRDFIAVNVDMDQEDVAKLMIKYDLNVIPVVDAANRLQGRITADDVIDVVEEEATEDIFRLAGSDGAELEHASAWKSCAIRLPWLMITLCGGFITSLILKKYLAHLPPGMLLLTSFVPIVLAMGGSAGIQSSTLVVRRIALGTMDRRTTIRVTLREIATGALMGIISGLLIGIWAHLLSDATSAAVALQFAAVVGLALFAAMTFAAVFGAVVPVALHGMKIDPAVASGPFITSANDVAASLIYFGITILLVRSVA